MDEFKKGCELKYRNYLGVPKLALATRRSRVRNALSNLARPPKQALALNNCEISFLTHILVVSYRFFLDFFMARDMNKT